MRKGKLLMMRSLSIGFISLLAWSCLSKTTPAQNAISDINPDTTLGIESSTIETQGNSTQGSDTFIGGGATRDINLFHSFESFDIGENDAAYFVVNDSAITNIFSRVTGNNPSTILGILGSRSDRNGIFFSTANLYFMNPNGVVFGPRAQLNLGGALVVTTADAVQFMDEGTFSATSPDAPSDLLTINPSAFLFSQRETLPTITVQSAVANATPNSPLDGLRVADGSSLTLLGGDIQIQEGILTASNGRIELGAVRGSGAVGLAATSDRNLSLVFPAELTLADIFLDSSVVNTNGSVDQPTSGEIQMHSRQLGLNASQIQSSNFGLQAGGGIDIEADQLVLNQSAIGTAAFSTAAGGTINISAGSIDMQNGSQILALSNSGEGDSGDIVVTATGNVNLVNQSQFGSLFIGAVSSEGKGSAGNIDIQAENLNFQQRSGVGSFTFLGRGESGNVTLTATNDIIQNNGTFSTASLGENASGNVIVDARNFSLENAGSVVTNAYDPTAILSSDFDAAGFDAPALAFARSLLQDVEPGTFGQGDAGTISVKVSDTLNLTGGGQLLTGTFGSGRAGDIGVIADTVTLSGIRPDQVVSSGIISETALNVAGRAGDVNILTREFSVAEGASISTATFGTGEGGNLTVTATGSTNISGSGVLNSSQFSGVTRSNLRAIANSSGRAGNIELNTGQLSIQSGGGIETTAFSSGQAGDISITADSINLNGVQADGFFSSAITSGTNLGTSGNAGSLTISTRTLAIEDGATISTATSGSGEGANLTITATESTDISGSGNLPNNPFVSVPRSSLQSSTNSLSRAGDIVLNTGRLSISAGGGIEAATSSTGRAGDIFIVADSIDLSGVQTNGLFQSTITSETGVNVAGQAGNIRLFTRTLDVQDGASISTATFGTGEGGNLTVTATDSTNISGSGVLNSSQFSGVTRSNLRANTNSSGRSGNIVLHTGQLSVREGGGIEAITFDSGQAGDISITADSINLNGVQADGFFSSAITSGTNLGTSGNAGSLTISTRTLAIEDGATISTATSGSGEGANLTITATESTDISGSGNLPNNPFVSVPRSSLQSSTNGLSRAGDIVLNTGRLSISAGGGIEAATSSTGRAGDIFIIADSIDLSGVQTNGLFQSTINSETVVNSTGGAGNIRLSTRTLDVQNGAGISTATFGTGEGGNLAVVATESVSIAGSNEIENALFFGPVRSGLRSNTNSSGRAGNVELTTGDLYISEGGGIEAVTFGEGRAGDIRVIADLVDINGTQIDGLFASAITSEAAAETGDAGNLSVIADRLNLRDGAVISTSTLGSGAGGSLTVSATDAVSITGNSPVINEQSFGSRLITSTSGTGQAGKLQLSADSLQVQDGGLILASSFGDGAAGPIFVSADRIELSGTAFDGQILSGIGSSSDVGTGNAGNINVTGRSLLIEEGAIVNTTARAGGAGGSITLNLTETLDANNGTISSAVSSTRGGDINITSSALRFRDDSNILTTSQTGNGGNINITAPAIVLLEDSDIFAFAPKGEGGNITFNTRALLSDSLFLPAPMIETVQADEALSDLDDLDALDTNGRIDINASGVVSGQVSDTPDITFLDNSITDISTAFLDSESIIANSCIVRSDRQSGTFLTSNANSLQISLESASPANYPTGTVSATGVASGQAPTSNRAIEEPQEIYRLVDGRLIMSRECL